jgi:NAD(P)-dependent dehydrogenase (short-subunit alcohol dehydrogenase family)
MRLDGKTVLITGSTDGVGRRVAVRLGQMGARVLVHGRNQERGEAVCEEIRAAGNQRVAFFRADLASLAEVRRLASAVRHDHDRIHVLINNAGLGSGGRSARRETSGDGFELRFAVNYLAGFLLTWLLLPTLRSSAPARIVNVASAGQYPIDFNDVMLTRTYVGGRAYMQSKLAQVMFTFDLARELESTGVTVNCLHPATYMDTTMVREAGTQPISTVDEGADAIINLAASPTLTARTGLYYVGLRPGDADPQAYDEEARRKLRALSLQLTGLAPASAAE